MVTALPFVLVRVPPFRWTVRSGEVPLLPVTVPGAAVSLGMRTCRRLTVPATTLKVIVPAVERIVATAASPFSLGVVGGGFAPASSPASASRAAAKASFKALEAEIELLGTQIKARMGAAALLLGPNGKPLCTWKNNKDGSKTDWQAVAVDVGATPEKIAEHTKTTPGARPFLVK